MSLFRAAVCSLFLMHAATPAIPAPKGGRLDRLYAVRYPWSFFQEAEIITKPFWIESDSFLLELPIIPDNLFEVQTDVVTPEGVLILPRSTHLMRVSGSVLALCTVLNPSSKELKRIRNITKSYNVCFTKSDRNGAFDRMHSGPIYVHTEREYIHKEWKPVKGFSASEIGSEKLQDNSAVQLRYKRTTLTGNNMIFDICWKYLSQCFVEDVPVSTSTFPVDFRLAGGVFRIHEKKDGKLLVSQIAKVPKQPLLIDNTPYN